MKTIKTIALLALMYTPLLFVCMIASNNSEDRACGEPLETSSKYDITALEAWCGEPQGACRMIGGWYHDANTIETEDGALWDVNTDSINEYEFLLVWFDTMGTEETEDDQIIKIWSEVYD